MIKNLKLYPAITCHLDDSIINVAKAMKEKHARTIYVVDTENKPVGIISGTDFTNKVIAEGKSPVNLKAKDIMNHPVECVEKNQEVEIAMAIMMRRKNYACLVTENGKVAGVIDYKSALEAIVSKLQGR